MRAAAPIPAAPPGSDRRTLAPLVVGVGIVMAMAFVWVMLTGSYAQYAAFILACCLLLVTLPIARHAARVESWPALSGLVIVGLVVRLLGSLARYAVAYGAYGGVADASTYTTVARNNYKAFRQLHIFTPNTTVFHGLIPWLDTVVYAVVGPTEIGSFFLFAWINFLGTYLFFRAFRIGYPAGDGRRYAALIFFIPSLVYWPSSLGKEGWMMFAIGLATYGLARALVGRPGGYLLLMAGVGGMILVRPHLALIFLPAAIIAFVLRRSQPGQSRRTIGRLVGIGVLVLSSLVVVGKAQSYFGIKSLDVQTVTQQLQTTRTQTELGNSAFHPPNAQSPIGYPEAVVTVLFRPFPFEAHGVAVLVASFEGLVLLGLSIAARRRLRQLPAALRDSPFVLFCVLYSALFILAFSNFGNFGILARERVQMLPMYLALLAIPVAAAPRVSRRRRHVRRRASRDPNQRLPSYTPSSSRVQRLQSTSTVPAGFRAVGYQFSVRVQGDRDGQIAADIARAMSPMADRHPGEHVYTVAGLDPSGSGRVRLERDGRVIQEGGPWPDVLTELITDVNAAAVLSRKEKLGVHAAAVSFQGRGLLIPGPSGSGKSTLAAALVKAGCDYLTDEAAFVNLRTGLIEPYPKPLSLTGAAVESLGMTWPDRHPRRGSVLPASFFGAAPTGTAAPVRMIVVPSYEPRSAVFLRPMSRAQALVEVANNSFNFVQHGGAWLESLARLVRGATCWRLHTGAPSEAAELLLARLGSSRDTLQGEARYEHSHG